MSKLKLSTYNIYKYFFLKKFQNKKTNNLIQYFS